MHLNQILKQAIEEQASDVFIVAGLPASFRKNGMICQLGEERLLPNDTAVLLEEIYKQAGERDMRELHQSGDDDFSFAIPWGCQDFVSALINKESTLSSNPYYYI